MDIFNEAEMELGLEPGELAGTFPANFVKKITCQQEDVMDNATVRKHKAALTRAKKVGPQKVVEVCTAALEDFEDNGFPDCWNIWKVAKEDAIMKLRYEAW